MKKLLFFCSICFITIAFLSTRTVKTAKTPEPFWTFKSIDTMKYSRDVAREKLHDQSFDLIIDQQIGNIAKTGATHVAIATPYDEEFLPILNRWVSTARKYNLKVWFRGNWSGWEGWFGYEKIDRATHIEKTKQFILKNPNLFESGDVFTACPECENGGSGDPRLTRDIEGHRQFLIDEYKMTTKAFQQIKKNVVSNYDSMNGDVARLIMDKPTTQALGGIVTIDHYVATPEKMADDIIAIAGQSGGSIIVGEFGSPIPDIHGNQTEQEQANWIDGVFQKLITIPQVKGMSYWTNTGGSTELWDGKGTSRQAVSVVTKYYAPRQITLSLTNTNGKPISSGFVIFQNRKIYVSENGSVVLPYFNSPELVTMSAKGYITKTIQIESGESPVLVTLDHSQESKKFDLRGIFKLLFPF